MRDNGYEAKCGANWVFLLFGGAAAFAMMRLATFVIKYLEYLRYRCSKLAFVYAHRFETASYTGAYCA